jgi:hypothetical protein
MTDAHKPEMLTRKEWRQRGYIVPSTASPDKIESFRRGRYDGVRHLFCFQQVRPVSDRRAEAAKKALATRVRNMEEAMRTVPLTIVREKSNHEIYRLAVLSHGGNYGGVPGPFYWSNRKARNAIRHNLTNYEAQWSLINRG